MDYILKQVLIIGSIFLIILWYQNQDDKRYNKKRISFYDKYKFPILVSSIVGLLLQIPNLFNKTCINTNLAKPYIHNNNFGMNIEKNKLTWFNGNNTVSDQQIFTDLPDF